jgi:hypothetical protein
MIFMKSLVLENLHLHEGSLQAMAIEAMDIMKPRIMRAIPTMKTMSIDLVLASGHDGSANMMKKNPDYLQDLQAENVVLMAALQMDITPKVQMENSTVNTILIQIMIRMKFPTQMGSTMESMDVQTLYPKSQHLL